MATDAHSYCLLVRKAALPKAWSSARSGGALLARAPYTLHSKLETEVTLLRERLTDRKRHQELADELTERYDWATHHLLNRVDRKKTPPIEWKVQVDAFRLEILEILKRHGCSRQEITHFGVINQFEMAQLDMPFSTAMFLIRVGRMTGISNKHARIAESRLLPPD